MTDRVIVEGEWHDHRDALVSRVMRLIAAEPHAPTRIILHREFFDALHGDHEIAWPMTYRGVLFDVPVTVSAAGKTIIHKGSPVMAQVIWERDEWITKVEHVALEERA